MNLAMTRRTLLAGDRVPADRAGRFHRTERLRPAEALEAYREILFVDSQHEGARLALEAFLTNATLRADAANTTESPPADYPPT